jgi:predicted  nucleic acid-binding Zn-ribbon protein
MKRLAFILTALFYITTLSAQTDEILTNSSIVKMVKARLADELVIDVIQSSKVAFDLSDNAVASLKNDGISLQVIDAMKATSLLQANNRVQTPAAPPVVVKTPVTKAVKENTKPTPVLYPASVAFSPESIDALGYVVPVKDLIQFYEDNFHSMDKTVSDWDKAIKGILADINEVNIHMEQLEADIILKKNADARGYSAEILALKKKLTEDRTKYKLLKSKMLTDGTSYSEKLTSFSEEMVKAISKKYDDVCSKIKSVDANPALGENPMTVSFETLTINNDVEKYIVPTAELFHWYQNEIMDIRGVIGEWDIKVKEMVQKDALLKEQLKPLEKQMQDYKQNAKQNKDEISGLKKQISEIDKERKMLADRMEDESKQFATFLKESGETIQNSIKERFTDIIQNVNYLYHEKLNV